MLHETGLSLGRSGCTNKGGWYIAYDNSHNATPCFQLHLNFEDFMSYIFRGFQLRWGKEEEGKIDWQDRGFRWEGKRGTLRQNVCKSSTDLRPVNTSNFSHNKFGLQTLYRLTVDTYYCVSDNQIRVLCSRSCSCVCLVFSRSGLWGTITPQLAQRSHLCSLC
jgi:hypothetical protein